jgi:hypothetical protein
VKHRKLYIFVLLFLLLWEETEGISYNERMVISNALPVQFWLEGCDTYNESENYGVHPKCFFQPFTCSDEIQIQFRGGPLTDYDLLILDESGATIETIPFTVSSSTEYFQSYPFIGWENTGTGLSWTEGAAPSITLTLLAQSSKRLSETISGLQSGTYSLGYNITSTDGEISLAIAFRKNGQVLDSNTIILANGANIGTSSFVLSDEPDQITVSCTRLENGSVTVTLNSFELESADIFSVTIVPLDYEICDQRIRLKIRSSSSPEEDIARTDLLDIQPTQPGTKLISYTNERNFAGIVYEGLSPDITFYLRVPCRFFHEQFPQADEAMELTSSILTTSSQKKKQKLLEVELVPYYFHNKVIEVLQHHTVSMDNDYWKKEEAYTINPGDKRWPVKTATCWLTNEGSVVRNVI